jgi:hypothetical protein
MKDIQEDKIHVGEKECNRPAHQGQDRDSGYKIEK